MPSDPERIRDSGGHIFKDILAVTLKELQRVESGDIPETPTIVTTTSGAMPILPTTVELIRTDLENVWGETYPELFAHRGARLKGLLALVKNTVRL